MSTCALIRCITLMCCTTGVSGQFSGGPGVGGATSCLPSMIVLPVELLHSEASCVDGLPMITWSTATERNNSHFLIERSVDGVSWDTVGQVAGAGNSQQVIAYSWHDGSSHLEGVMYYRLRQVDLDGRDEVFPILALEACADVHPQLLATPNPTGGELAVRWSSQGKITELRVLDLKGRVLLTRMIAPEGRHSVLDLSNVDSGIYLLEGMDRTGGRSVFARVVRQ